MDMQRFKKLKQNAGRVLGRTKSLEWSKMRTLAQIRLHLGFEVKWTP
jgi:hypothetical protein